MKKLLLTFVLMFCSVIAIAQVTTSSIKGLILDETDQPLPGANIVVVHTPTGTTYGVATNLMVDTT